MAVVQKSIELDHVQHTMNVIDKNCGVLKGYGIINFILKLWNLCDDKIFKQPLLVLLK
jgi:hypothetical protein